MEENSIEHTLHAIIIASWFFGVGIAYPLNYPKAVTIILRIIHFGVCSVIVVFDTMDCITFGNVFKSNIFKIAYYINKVVCYVSAYYYVYHGIRHYNKWPKLLNKINNLDRMIRDTQNRETPVNNQSVKRIEALAIFATITCGPLSFIIHALYYYFTRHEGIFAPDLLLYYIITRSLIISFVFDVIVYVLYHRFQTLNELIEQIDEQFDTLRITLKIRCIREIHTEIYKLVIMVNDIHGFHLFLCSTNCFTMAVTMLFKIYMGIVEKNHAYMLTDNILWILYVAKFGLMCWVCTLVSREADKTGIIIHTIVPNFESINHDKQNDVKNQTRLEISSLLEGSNDKQNSNPSSSFSLNIMENLLYKDLDCVRNEIYGFSIQLLQHRVAFTACDLLEMNNTLFRGFVGVITTYFIILVQLHQARN